MMVDERADFLVIGSGIAGLWGALRLADHGRVIVITKKDEAESNTNYAQGGIAAVMSQLDSVESHLKDTLTVGCGLCNRRVVRRVVSAAPRLVRDLMEVGVRFTYRQTPRVSSNLDLGLEGGHSAPRVVHATDLTGQEIEAALLRGLTRHPNASLWVHHLAIDLMVTGIGSDRRCVGAWVLDRYRRLIRRIAAPVTILATGGAGQVYRHTTNPEIATGDGVAMAFRAGVPVANMEFVQFHPTRLHHPQANRFLISEAVRGAGGILRNAKGEAFMVRYHPLHDLAPRDVVARAIVMECRRSGSAHAWLDLTHLRPSFIRRRFPNIARRCRGLGIDITRQAIPVVPAAHYMCGGVVTDASGRTELSGLWASGEVAHTGLHGANRLASNSLLEAMYFADVVAASAGPALRRLRHMLPARLPHSRLTRIRPIARLKRDWALLRNAMWDDVGIIREHDGLARAVARLTELWRGAERRLRVDGVNADTIEFRNAALVGLLVARSALQRTESRGLQYRSDYPSTDDTNWKKDTLLRGPLR
jgi:L-aspartate oxidase